MAIQTLRSYTTGATLHQGDYPSLGAALTHCAVNGIELPDVDLRGAALEGTDISGLRAPNADLRGANMRNIVANRLVGGRQCDLSAALLQGAGITGNLTEADLSCTHPTIMRAELGPNTRIKGASFDGCPDVMVLASTSRGTHLLAVRNGTGWKLHTGDDRDGASKCLAEAQAITLLSARAEYAAALTWLQSADGTAAKATIDARQPGSGTPIRPSEPMGGSATIGASRK